MAYKDSDELKTDERYPLGDYSFRIERSSVPGSTNDKIEAICTGKDGKNARKSIQIPSSAQMNGWYVEANNTTADVYAVIKSDEKTNKTFTNTWGTVTVTGCTPDLEGHEWMAYIKTRPEVLYGEFMLISQYPQTFNASPTPYNSGRSGGLYWWNIAYGIKNDSGAPHFVAESDDQICQALWQGGGGGGGDSTKSVLVGRFAIELEAAGGVGPGSDWVDPGDWNEDPTTTLHLTIDGALSGRHNDPLNDTSYSYVPSDKATIKDYGCGGDGGNGGGGGAVASNIVVYKFATDRANSKEIICKQKRHGYGSCGGKGGKGGDVFILIYY